VVASTNTLQRRPIALAAPSAADEDLGRANRERALELALEVASEAAAEARAASEALRLLFARATGGAVAETPEGPGEAAERQAVAARTAEAAMRDASAASSELLSRLQQSRAAGDALTPELQAALRRHSTSLVRDPPAAADSFDEDEYVEEEEGGPTDLND
jgi:hypothetical protein